MHWTECTFLQWNKQYYIRKSSLHPNHKSAQLMMVSLEPTAEISPRADSPSGGAMPCASHTHHAWRSPVPCGREPENAGALTPLVSGCLHHRHLWELQKRDFLSMDPLYLLRLEEKRADRVGAVNLGEHLSPKCFLRTEKRRQKLRAHPFPAWDHLSGQQGHTEELK